MNNKLLFTAFILSFLTGPMPQAFGQTTAPGALTFQALITDLTDAPIVSSPVSMVVQIQAPNSCVLYSETFAPTTDAKGLVSLILGTGGSPLYATATTPITSFQKVFADDNNVVTVCLAGAPTLTLAPGTGRQLRFSIDGGVNFSGGFSISAVPYAFQADNAQTLNNIPAANFLTTATVLAGDVSGTSGAVSVNKILGNTIPVNAAGVLTNNGAGGLSWTAAAGGITQLTGDVTAGPGSGSQAATISNLAVSKLAAMGFNKALVTDGTGHLLTSATTDTQIGYLSTATSDIQTQINGKQASLGFTPVNKVGDTMTGQLNMSGAGAHIDLGTNNITSVGNITASGLGVTTVNATNLNAATLLDVGSGRFHVDVNGNVTKINNVTTSFPAVQGAASTVLTNDGAGTLSWSAVSDASKLPLAGGTMAGNLNMGGNNIINSGSINGVSLWATGLLDTASGKFHVDASGNITLINNVATNFPAAQGGVGTYLKNDGAGNLSWAAAAGGITSINGDNTAAQAISGGTNINAATVAGTTTIGITGQIPLANGGTAANLTASAGSIVYSGAGAMAMGPVGLSSQVLLSGAAGAPTWGNVENIKTSTTAGSLMFSNGTNIIQNNAKLFWDNTTFRLGIGTTTPGPGSSLDLASTGRIAGVNDPVNPQDAVTLNYLTSNYTPSATNATTYLKLDASNGPVTGALAISNTFSAGTGKFAVDALGNITKINNVTTAFPGAQGGAGTFLKNDGAGNLSWAAAGAGLTSINGDSTAAQSIASGTNITVADAGATHTISFSGTLPIASGGTNSNTALTNNKVMTSVGGAIVESATTTTELGYLSGATSSVQTQLNNKLNRDGTNSPTANLNMGGFKLTNLGAPTGNSTDAATTQYVVGVMGSYLPLSGGTMAGAFDMGHNGILNAPIIEGNNTPSGSLTLDSTGHPTKGAVLIQPSGGFVGIGVGAPTAKLHLPASSGAANTAPLKIDPGTILAAKEPGTLEYDGTHLYFTDSLSTRKDLLAASGGNQGGTTAAPGVAFATAGNTLGTDNANFMWNDTTKKLFVNSPADTALSVFSSAGAHHTSQFNLSGGLANTSATVGGALVATANITNPAATYNAAIVGIMNPTAGVSSIAAIYGQLKTTIPNTVAVYGDAQDAGTGSATGVMGQSDTGVGVMGQSSTNNAIEGSSTSGAGVRGRSTSGWAGYFETNGPAAVKATLVAKMGAGQTSNIFEVQDSTTTNVVWVDSTGKLHGDGSAMTGISDTSKLPLAGGTMTGNINMGGKYLNSVAGGASATPGLNFAAGIGLYYDTVNLALATGGTGRLFVGPAGNVSIGNVPTANMLDVTGDINSTTGYRVLNNMFLRMPSNLTSNIALGVGAGPAVSGTSNTLVGNNAGSGLGANSNNTMIGANAGAASTGTNNTYIGYQTTGNAAASSNGVAIGYFAKSEGYGVATGYNSKATGSSSIAIGSSSIASGPTASALSAIAIGSGNGIMGPAASGISSIAIGGGNSATMASADGAIAMGGQSALTSATAVDAIAIGDGAAGGGLNSVALGANAKANYTSAVALGNNAFAGGDYAVAIEGNVTAGSTDSISIGHGSQIAFGPVIDAIAIGHNAYTQANGAIALGKSTISNSDNSVVIGTKSMIGGAAVAGIAIGSVDTNVASSGAQAGADGAIAIGSGFLGSPGASAGGINSIAIGKGSATTAAGAVAIGDTAVANAAGAVQLAGGTNATANTVQFRGNQIADANGLASPKLKVGAGTLISQIVACSSVSTAAASQTVTCTGVTAASNCQCSLNYPAGAPTTINKIVPGAGIVTITLSVAAVAGNTNFCQCMN